MPFEGNFLTSDAARFRRSAETVIQAPQIAIGPPTIGWLYAACQAMHEASESDFAPAIKTPVLLASGSLDRVVSPRAIEALAGELRSGALVDHRRRPPRDDDGAGVAPRAVLGGVRRLVPGAAF